MAIREYELAARLRDNVARVRERMAAAAIRAGRKFGARLVAVTKYVEPAIARLLVTECGLTELAESRPQELWTKAEALADLRIEWHLIGHLQRNKVRRTLPLTALIQSADSLRLLAEIDREAAAIGCSVDVLLEVNTSGEAAKHGFQPVELPTFLPQIAALKNICVQGLMTMASLEGGTEAARRNFTALRELRDLLSGDCPPAMHLTELSMGMSGDYEIAIEEGATMIRIGSALFEGLT
jgi:pyridoxal phosphate enzyme (YggS family)